MAYFNTIEFIASISCWVVASNMVEMTLSLFAWLGVILVQAMIHYLIRSRRRLQEESPPPLEASPIVLESLLAQQKASLRDNKDETTTTADTEQNTTQDLIRKNSFSTDKTASIKSTESLEDELDIIQKGSFGLDEDDEVSFDGDEPRIFFQLLTQTGSEMMKVS